MLKSVSLALATLIGAAVLVPGDASAIDNGPCHKCEMEPIIVKGDRPKKKTTQTSVQQQFQQVQPAATALSNVRRK